MDRIKYGRANTIGVFSRGTYVQSALESNVMALHAPALIDVLDVVTVSFVVVLVKADYGKLD